MPDPDILIVVKDETGKLAAEAELSALIDAGQAEVVTRETLMSWFTKPLDKLADQISKLARQVAAVRKTEPEAEEEEIPTPDGNAIAQAALETWHRRGEGGSSITRPLPEDPPEPRPGPRIKPDANLEFIPPPDDDLTSATRETWRQSLRKRTRQGWGFFNSKLGGKRKT